MPTAGSIRYLDKGLRLESPIPKLWILALYEQNNKTGFGHQDVEDVNARAEESLHKRKKISSGFPTLTLIPRT